MSLKQVQSHIHHASHDGFISAIEADAILSRSDKWYKAPESIGTFVSPAEHKAIKDLYQKIEKGDIEVAPEARESLAAFVEAGFEKRWKHALKGGPKAKTWMASCGGTLGMAAGSFMAFATFVFGGFTVLPLLAFALYGGGGALAGVGIGYGAGVVHGLVDD